MVRWSVRVFAASLLVFGPATQADASPVTFNFTGTDFLTDTGGSQSWSLNGINLTATAWYANSSGVGIARLAGYQNYGLGVCNFDDGDCHSTLQGIDNLGQTDFVLFGFSPLVDLQQASLYAGAGTDVSYWMGNGVNTLTGTLGSLPGGLGSQYNGSGVTIALDNTNTLYSSLLLGARVGDSNDDFMIQSLTVQGSTLFGLDAPLAVPEPASLWLLGMGLFGAAALVQRRRRVRK